METKYLSAPMLSCIVMCLRPNDHYKDGKHHRSWSIVESKRSAGGKVVQLQVLYLGEIDDSQQEA